MTIEQAVNALYDRVHHAPWFTTIGVGKYAGKPCIFLYVNAPPRSDTAFLARGWHGYPVEVRKMGTPQLATNPSAP